MKYEVNVEIRMELDDWFDVAEFLAALEEVCDEQAEFSARINRESENEEVY